MSRDWLAFTLLSWVLAITRRWWFVPLLFALACMALTFEWDWLR